MSTVFQLASLEGESGVVLVPPGRHHGSVTITRSLTLRGASGAVLDGEGLHSSLRLDGPDAELRLENLAFENGGGPSGGSIHVASGRLVVSGCSFLRGASHRFGGGAIFSAGERLEVRRCRFEQNLGRQGGALLLDEEVEALICDSLFAYNAAVQGGALRLREGARATVVGCTFLANRTVVEGDGPGQGASFALSGSTTRRPALRVENSLIASAKDRALELHNDAVVPGEVQLLSSLVPPSLQRLAQASCRVGEVELSGSLAPERRGIADGLASGEAWIRVGSTDLTGAPRDAAVGAFCARR